jgi:hypothetical protein
VSEQRHGVFHDFIARPLSSQFLYARDLDTLLVVLLKKIIENPDLGNNPGLRICKIYLEFQDFERPLQISARFKIL